jgi:hypothetical protein
VLAIPFVGRKAADLLAERRTDPPASSGLAPRRADGVRVGQPVDTFAGAAASAIVGTAARKDANDDDGAGVEIEL